MRLDKYIKHHLEKEFNISLHKEIFSISIREFKSIKIEQHKKKIKVANVSLGFEKDLKVSSKPILLNSINAEDIFDNKSYFNNKILYFPYEIELSKLKNLKFLENIVLIVNKVVQKPIYLKEFPLIFIKNKIDTEKDIKLDIKTKKIELKGTNYFLDFGYGSYYLYIIFPYDSYLQSVNDLSFYGSFNVLKEIIRRILKVKYPRGYRTRILINDLSYFNYAGLEKHLENINMDNVLSFVNLECVGLGNEKLIFRNNRKLLDNFTYNRINTLFSKIGFPIKKEKLKNFSVIDSIIKEHPIIWLYSQPNKNLYNLKKEFLTKDFIDRISSGLFYIINNMYRGIL